MHESLVTPHVSNTSLAKDGSLPSIDSARNKISLQATPMMLHEKKEKKKKKLLKSINDSD